jgi:hypothetical protein
MKARHISVTFHVDVQNDKPWFPLPTSIAELFEMKAGDVLAVSISTPEGEPLYHGLAKLDTHSKNYKAHIGKILTKGTEIRVTACHPPKGTVRGS